MKETLEKYNKLRWYDRNSKVKQVFEIVESMSYREKELFADNLLKIIKLLRKQQSIKDFNLCLGRNKILSYYRAYNKRRWYDKIPGLMRAINLLSILSDNERNNIVDGILLSYSEKK